MAVVQIGMSRRDLEYELQWKLRRAPSDPARLQDFMNELLVHLIDMNNQAIAASLADRDRKDLPEGG
ncbi:hypothetical protein [Mesorhizobium sp. CN2-181]|uniref:hypothetical protein n=1 Tax=Mesorhizobium yinganensis TaxID=3157707 RepID=UPI0032B86A86